MMSMMKLQLRQHTGRGCLLRGFAVFFMVLLLVMPPLIMVKYAVSDRASIITGGLYPEPLVPFAPTLDIFRAVLSRDDFIKSGIVTLEIALLTVLFSLVIGTPAAFTLARVRFPGKKVILFFLISVRLFPDISAAIPIVQLFAYSTIPPILKVALSHTLLSLPYVLFIAVGVFETIPKDLEEQARVLGAGRLYTFVRIIVPLALPGLAAAAIYTFLLSWNEFVYSYFIMYSEPVVPLPVYLERLLAWTPGKDMLASIALLFSLPVIIFTLLVQKHMRSGLTAGAVK